MSSSRETRGGKRIRVQYEQRVVQRKGLPDAIWSMIFQNFSFFGDMCTLLYVCKEWRETLISFIVMHLPARVSKGFEITWSNRMFLELVLPLIRQQTRTWEQLRMLAKARGEIKRLRIAHPISDSSLNCAAALCHLFDFHHLVFGGTTLDSPTVSAAKLTKYFGEFPARKFKYIKFRIDEPYPIGLHEPSSSTYSKWMKVSNAVLAIAGSLKLYIHADVSADRRSSLEIGHWIMRLEWAMDDEEGEFDVDLPYLNRLKNKGLFDVIIRRIE